MLGHRKRMLAVEVDKRLIARQEKGVIDTIDKKFADK